MIKNISWFIQANIILGLVVYKYLTSAFWNKVQKVMEKIKVRNWE